MDRFQIPNLTALALQYGTISQEQYQHLLSLEDLSSDSKLDHGQRLMDLQFATRYQVALLELIREYLIIKKSGEEFGRMAVEKGFTTPRGGPNRPEDPAGSLS